MGSVSKRAALKPRPQLGTSVSLPRRAYQFLGQNNQAFNVLAPAEVASASQAVARQFFRQLRRFLNLQYSFRQRIGRETGEINSRISADFAMHRQIGRNYRQAARHRLDQRMRERFRISWGHINVAGLIEVMKRAIRNRSELYDISSKIICEQGRRLGSI